MNHNSCICNQAMGNNSAGRNTARRGKPGPKPGSRHAGMFTPGDPRINRAGYTKEMRMKNKQLEDLAREHADEALAAVLDVLQTGSGAERLRAAEALLDRAFGKPIDRQAVLTMGPSGEAVEEMSEAQLLRIANGALEFTNQSSGFRGQVIDLRPVPAGDDDDPPPHAI
jgi:hypothetical protein